MTTDKSAASVDLNEVIRAAVATIPEVRQFEEYANLTEESALYIVNDALATKHIWRTNGQNVEDFPSYYGLRFIATADEDRGFFHASNSRKLRAACLKLYTLNYGKKDADANAPKREKRATDTSGQTKIFIEVQDSMDAMIEDATMQVILFCQKRAASKLAKAQEAATNVVAKLTDDQKRALLEMLQAQLSA